MRLILTAVLLFVAQSAFGQVRLISELPRGNAPTQNDPFIVQHDGDTVNIFGPWHNSRTVYYATLSRPTRQQIEAALATARRTWDAERKVSRSAPPKESSNADGSNGLPVGSVEALDELNELRAKRGLKPYIRDNGLTLAAARAAKARADRLLFGHLENDFACLPSGTRADAAGCAAYPAQDGFLACCMYDSSFRFAGAVSILGRDGRMYHHLFVRR